jgi:NTE family protein
MKTGAPGPQSVVAPGPRVGLALGGGSARGLAHIMMLEVFDELGIKPSAIAGTSIGAIIGGLYAAGLSAHEIRNFAEELLSKRSEIFIRLAKSYGGWPSLWSVRRPSVVDGVTLFELLMPPQLRCDFARLRIPFHAVAVDYYAMQQVVITSGPVIPAIAASAALPTILKPVTIGGRILVDGGFINPTPWDVIQPIVDFTVAVDVTGQTDLTSGPPQSGTALPTTLEAWVGCTQILFHTITREKLKQRAPDLMIRPAVGTFGTMDFVKIREIFAASEPAKDELKRALQLALN